MIESVAGDVGRSLCIKRLWRAVKDNPAFTDDHGARAHGFHFFKNVGGKHHGTVIAESANEFAHFMLLIWIKPVGRFVKNQNRWVMQNRLRQSGASLVSLGKRVYQLTAVGFQVQAFNGAIDARPRFRTHIAARTRHEVQELFDAHVSVGRRAFGQVSEGALGSNRFIGKRNAVQGDGAGRGLKKSGEHAHGGALSCAVWPKESQHLPGGNDEIDPSNRFERTKGFTKSACRDQFLHGAMSLAAHGVMCARDGWSRRILHRMSATTKVPVAVRALESFARRFGGRPTVLARAPGRVTLIGEHVDYSDGLVLPMSIDRDCVSAVRVSNDGRWRAWSDDLQSLTELPDPATASTAPRATGAAAWSNLALGVLAGFAREGVRVPPLEMAFASDVPLGAGLSSSAALTVSLATAVAEVLSAPLFGIPLARMCQEAESEFGGGPCGMLDPLASALGRADHAMLIDCRSLDVRFVPFPPAARVALLVFDSGVHRSLSDGRYAERRHEVEDAARAAGVGMLRDLDETKLRTLKLPALFERRARHVVREIQRVQLAANALRRDDMELFGLFMAQSHQSLRDDFAVSTPELDALVDEARALGTAGGVYGARLTGAGFGGSVIVLADAARTGIGERIAAGFERRFKRPASWQRVSSAPGAAVIPAARWPAA